MSILKNNNYGLFFLFLTLCNNGIGYSTDRRVNDRRTVIDVETKLDLARRKSTSDLRDRVRDIKAMEGALKTTLAATNAEVARSTSTIAELDTHIRHVKSGPQPTSKENLTMRQRRLGIDQVIDQVDEELNQELKVINDCLVILNDVRVRMCYPNGIKWRLSGGAPLTARCARPFVKL